MNCSPSKNAAVPCVEPRRILLLDDEENVRRALCRTLQREGYEVVSVAEPEQALQALKAEAFDLVLSDHLMPSMTGLEFLKLVRDRHPDCMRIMLTGHADMQTAIDAINHGEIYRFLTKPWDNVELTTTLFFALQQLDLERENRRVLAIARHRMRTPREQPNASFAANAWDLNG